MWVALLYSFGGGTVASAVWYRQYRKKCQELAITTMILKTSNTIESNSRLEVSALKQAYCDIRDALGESEKACAIYYDRNAELQKQLNTLTKFMGGSTRATTN